MSPSETQEGNLFSRAAQAWFAAMHRAMTSEDESALRALVHPDFVMYEDPGMPYGGVFKGPDAFVRVALAVKESWREQRLEKLHYSESPETSSVSIAFRMRARAKTTGEPVEIFLSEIWKFRDGLGVEAYVWYWNTPSLVSALRGEKAS